MLLITRKVSKIVPVLIIIIYSMQFNLYIDSELVSEITSISGNAANNQEG